MPARAAVVVFAMILLSPLTGVAQAGESCNGLDELVARAEERARDRDYRKVLAMYEEARNRWAGCKDSPLSWRIWFGLADANLDLGRHDEAVALLPVVEQMADGNLFRQSKTARFAAAIHHRAGDLGAAERYALRAIDYAVAGGHVDREVDALSMLATIYSLSGRNRDSLAVNKQLVALEREHDLTSLLAKSLNNIGIDYRHFGRYGEAVAVLDESLALYRELDNPIGQARALYNKANVYAETGDIEYARELKLESLALTETVGDTYGLALLHSDLAELFLFAGNLDAAEHHAKMSLAVNEGTKQAYGMLNALVAAGTVERRREDWEKAASTFQRGVEVADETGYQRLAAMHRIGLAFTQIARGNGDAALRLASEAEAIALEQDHAQVLIDAMEAKGRALETLSRTADAIRIYLDAIDILESWRGRLVVGDLKVGFAERRWGVFEGAIRMLVAEGRSAESFDIAERARARLLLELISARYRREQAYADEIGELEARLRQRFRTLGRVSAHMQSTIAREVQELQHTLDAMLEEARLENPVDAMLRHPQPMSLDALRASLLEPERGLVAFFWGEGDVYAWMVRDSEVRAVRLGGATELETLVDFLESAIDHKSAAVDWRVPARRAHSLLLEPLQFDGLDEIIAVVDGPLARIPLEALVASDSDLPLGASTRIYYGPSASVVAALGERPRSDDDSGGVLTVGYSPDAGQPPIPFAVREAGFIAGLFEEEGTILLTGDSATVENWLAAEPGRHDILHFASHTIIDDTRPDATTLILAGEPLELGMIRDLDLRAELVTLSACETALGRRVRGEGIVGLTHAFLAAGARGLIVTTRAVEDQIAADFMHRFYTRYHRSRNIQDALHATRMELILNDAAPDAWAPFILVGGLH